MTAKEVPQTMHDGEHGEHFVGGHLIDIGWAPPVKIKSDIGDDLLTFARVTVPKVDNEDGGPGTGTELFDISAPVILQVKTSPTDYVKPKSKKNGKPGWWFWEEKSKGHFDHWIGFGLPYLLVFHDLKNRISYWAHVTGPNIEKTAHGRRKIFVPFDQTISPECRDDLNKVATSQQEPLLAGSWSGRMSSLAPGQRLRYALVVPRLVAPHPNKSPDQVSSEEAVALILLDRGSEIHRHAAQEKCPPVKSWRRHREWGWRFADAFLAALDDGDTGPMLRLAEKAPSRPERDAARVVAGCAAFVAGRVDDALKAFVPVRHTRPVDRGWLFAHKAHMLFESGASKDAAAGAKKALTYLNSVPDDVAAAALRGGCAAVLYATSAWTPTTFEETLAAQDNLGTLWRSQAVSSALGRDLNDRFREWSDDRSQHIVTSTAFSQLTTAGWNAAFACAWGTWRDLTAQGARVTLTSSNDPADVEGALEALVRVGHKQQVRMATRKVWTGSPLDALATQVTALASAPWTLRSEGAVLAMLSESGDLLTEAAADSAIARIIDLITTDGPVRRLGNGTASRWAEIDTALRRLLDAASIASHQACAELICAYFADTAMNAVALTRVATGIKLDELHEDLLDRLVAAAGERTDYYRTFLLEIVGQTYPPAVNAIKHLAKAGDPIAARALVVAGETDKENWADLGRVTVANVRKLVKDATPNRGTFAFAMGGEDSLHDLTLAAFNTGNNRHWKAVTDALDAGVLPGSLVSQALEFLSTHFDELPTHVQTRLRKIAPGLRIVQGFGLDDASFGSARLALMSSAGLLNDDATLIELLRLKAETTLGFVRVLSVASTGHREVFLLSAAVNPDPDVRAEAGYGLIELATKRPAKAEKLARVLLAALEVNDGGRMPVVVASGLARMRVPAMDIVRDALREHPSAAVRSRLK